MGRSYIIGLHYVSLMYGWMYIIGRDYTMLAYCMGGGTLYVEITLY